MSTKARRLKGSRYRCLLATSFDTTEVYDLLMKLCKPLEITITTKDEFFPKGFEDHKEMILTSERAKDFWDTHFPDIGFDAIQENVRDEWWLKPKKGGNTPNWDLVSSCTLKDSRKALLLVEAKAHVNEFDKNGKKLDKDASEDSEANHNSIKEAIGAAMIGLNTAYKADSFKFDIDNCYQLTNRFAYAWKLASLDIPVVLMYLGFVNAYEMGDDYFKDDKHWEESLYEHSKGRVPRDIWNSDPIKVEGTPIYAVHRAMDIRARPDIIKIY